MSNAIQPLTKGRSILAIPEGNKILKFIKQGQVQSPREVSSTENSESTQTEPSVTPPGKSESSQSKQISSNSIIKMQNAIKDLANTVVKEDEYKIENINTEQLQPQLRKNINNYLTEQYVDKATRKGLELSTDPSRSKWEEKQPKTNFIDMNVIVKNFLHVGSSSNEFIPDGVWGRRTNNALNNICAFVEGLLNFSKSHSVIQSNAFSEADLNEMKKYIPTNEAQLKTKYFIINKNIWADKLTILIKKVKAFYNDISKSIIENPYYRPYMEGNRPLHTVQLGQEDAAKLSDEEDLMLKNQNLYLYNMQLPDANNNLRIVSVISLKSLEDPDYFKIILKRDLGYTDQQLNDPRAQKNVLNRLMQNIDTAIESKHRTFTKYIPKD